MHVNYIDNACAIYESKGFRLLSDPWLTDGAFEGSWYHEKGKLDNLDWSSILSVDALYISHVHPDHYDPATLSKFRKDIPIYILDTPINFLSGKLIDLGFTNIRRSKSGDTVLVGPFKITLYAPFSKHPFDDSVLGSFIDSAMVIEDDKKLILNANDNTPTEEAAEMLVKNHGVFDQAQLKYSCAGPYPSCFLNLSHDEKLAEKRRLLTRQRVSMNRVAEILGARAVPFAGDYILAGSLAHKNQYLAIEGLDLTKVPEGKPYDYELDGSPDLDELVSLLHKARGNLWEKQTLLNFFPDYSVSINFSFNNYSYCIDFKHDDGCLGRGANLECYLDPRLLRRILTKQSHWNNAEVGCHIDFYRTGPYIPDISTMMSFFHI